MPITYNGIGTHYYGKKDRSVRDGVCRSCQSATKLESYNTRLWFVVFFIPVIPLGRKRILDACPRCRRHYAAGVEQWEMQRQLNVSAAKDRFRESPSPESALQAHAAMLSFHVHDEAAQFREEALQAFPTSATLCAGLAMHLDQVNEYAQATPLFEQALALSPDMPEARVGLALRRLNEKRFDEARELLDHLMQPGALRIYPIGPIDALMSALQKAGKHQQALEIAAHILTEVPEVGEQHKFRKFVTTSERALGNRESILPPTTFSLRDLFDWHSTRYSAGARWGFALAICSIVLLSGLAIQNEYRRRHRRLDIVNGLEKPVQVAIDGAAPVEFKGTGQLPIAEGVHHVRLTGSVNEEFDVDMHAGYFQRWTYSPRWIINPGGAVAFQHSTVHYATTPRAGKSRLIVGEHFVVLPHADYFFENPPQTMTMDSWQSEVVKEVLQQVSAPPAQTFTNSLGSNNKANSFTFAEAALRRKADDADLCEIYGAAAVALNELERARKFLKPRLGDRPVRIAWHRAYQQVEECAGNGALQAEYQAALQQDRGNAALLYLTGRVTVDRKIATQLFKQSTQADPKLPWGWYALAYDDASHGDWKPCLEMLGHIPKGTPLSGHMVGLSHTARLGGGEAPLIETECRQKLGGTRGLETLADLIFLVDALSVQGKTHEAQQAMSLWESRLPPEIRKDPAMNTLVRPIIWYCLADFESIKKACQAHGVPPSPLLVAALVATGEQEAILKRPEVLKMADNPETALDLSIACQLSGNAEAAKSWRDKGAAGFEKQGRELRLAATLLRSDQPPKLAELEALTVMPTITCRLATLFALRFPQQKGEFVKLARKLNVSRQPPYYLVERALK